MTEVGELLAARDHVFLDFDGPDLPADLAASGDPFDVLAYAASCGPGAGAAVERQLSRLEQEAVALATPTPGLVELLDVLIARGFTVTIVSNNSVKAVRAFLTLHGLTEQVRRISARTSADLTRLKPSPALLESAMRALGASPGQCVMVGDSVRDLEAARAAGVASIVFAPTPRKRARLGAQAPDAVVDTLARLRLAG